MSISSLSGSFEQGLQRGKLEAQGKPDNESGSPIQSLMDVIGDKIPRKNFRVDYTPANEDGAEKLVVTANECFVDGIQDYDFVPSLEIEGNEGNNVVTLKVNRGDHRTTSDVHIDSAAESLGEFCGQYGEDAGTVLAIY